MSIRNVWLDIFFTQLAAWARHVNWHCKARHILLTGGSLNSTYVAWKCKAMYILQTVGSLGKTCHLAL